VSSPVANPFGELVNIVHIMNTLTLYPLLQHWTTPLFCKVVDVSGTSLIEPRF